MEHVTRILEARLADDDRSKFPISWSDAYIEKLREMARKEGTLRSPLDDQLAAAILLCPDGRFQEAERQVIRLMWSSLELIRNDQETFISFLFALFTCQQFDLLAAMLRDRYGFKQPFTLGVEEGGPDKGLLRWDISADGHHRFVFGPRSYQHDYTRSDILAFQWAFPLYANYSYSDNLQTGSVVINQGDKGNIPGLAWCDSRPDYFLVPDCIFVPTKGYEAHRRILTEEAIPWEDRKPVAFWRGGTTGVPRIHGDWRSLERIELCEIARRYEHLGIIDAGLSSVIQWNDPAIVEEIRNSGLFRGFVPWQKWGQFKYQIDIDGNSSPWSNLFQRMLTGCTILKVESARSLQQWFYDELIPWENYIPIAPDMSDLIPKIEWLIKNDSYARAVGEAGRRLADRLTYEREVQRSAATIANAFRYFRGDHDTSGPFGRPRHATQAPHPQT